MKRIYTDADLQNEILKEAHGKKFRGRPSLQYLPPLPGALSVVRRIEFTDKECRKTRLLLAWQVDHI